MFKKLGICRMSDRVQYHLYEFSQFPTPPRFFQYFSLTKAGHKLSILTDTGL